MIDNAIKTLLEAVAGPNVLASPSSSPITFKAGSSPRIAFTALPGDRGGTDDGCDGLNRPRYQLDVVGSDLATVRSIIAKLTKSATTAPPAGLEGYKGTVDGTVIEWITFPSTARSGGSVQLKTDGNGAAVCRMMIDMIIVHRD